MAVPLSSCRGALLCLKMYMVMWLRRNTAPCPPAGKVLGPLFGCKKACTDTTTHGCLADPELCVYTRWSLCPRVQELPCTCTASAPPLRINTTPHPPRTTWNLHRGAFKLKHERRYRQAYIMTTMTLNKSQGRLWKPTTMMTLHRRQYRQGRLYRRTQVRFSTRR